MRKDSCLRHKSSWGLKLTISGFSLWASLLGRLRLLLGKGVGVGDCNFKRIAVQIETNNGYHVYIGNRSALYTHTHTHKWRERQSRRAP